MKYKTCIVLIRVGSNSDRTVLERIQNEKFDNREAVEKAICFDEDYPTATEDLGIYDLNDFMDACNNTYDDTPEDEKIVIMDNWVGYIQMKVKY